MIRERWKIGTMLAAIGAMFRTKELQRALPQAESPRDEYHHARNRHSGDGRLNAKKYRRHRNVKNEMAFQSRKRNRV